MNLLHLSDNEYKKNGLKRRIGQSGGYMEREIEQFSAYLLQEKHASSNTEISYKRDLKKLELYLKRQDIQKVEEVTPLLKKKEKDSIESRCGICCSKCQFLKDKVCQGCIKITKPFWGDSCPVKSCVESKKLACCGECSQFPCDLLHSFAYDEEQGDNGLRIENCKKWCCRK